MKNQLPWALCLIVLFMLACKAETTTDKADDKTAAVDTTEVMAPAEFADPKYSDIVKSGQAAFSSGDIASWMTTYADNVVYVWNNGDSLVGKQAVSDYWIKRRSEVIDTITFSNEIYLPVKVNTPQSVEQTGIWVLSWYQTTAKYTGTGKSMTQWIHSDSHFDANDKIDRVITYLDRAPISAAMTK